MATEPSPPGTCLFRSTSGNWHPGSTAPSSSRRSSTWQRWNLSFPGPSMCVHSTFHVAQVKPLPTWWIGRGMVLKRSLLATSSTLSSSTTSTESISTSLAGGLHPLRGLTRETLLSSTQDLEGRGVALRGRGVVLGQGSCWYTCDLLRYELPASSCVPTWSQYHLVQPKSPVPARTPFDYCYWTKLSDHLPAFPGVCWEQH